MNCRGAVAAFTADDPLMSWSRPNSDTAISPGGAALPDVPKTCQRCNMMLDNDFPIVNGRPTCDYCAKVLKGGGGAKPVAAAPVAAAAEQTDEDPIRLAARAAISNGNTALGFAYGFAASLVSTVLYAGVTIATHFDVGFLSAAVGWLVGKAMRKGNGAPGSTALRIGAAAFACLALVLAHTAIGLQDTELGGWNAFGLVFLVIGMFLGWTSAG